MANIPQSSVIGVTQSELQNQQANRRTSLMQNLASIIMQNRQLKEQQRQYDTNKTFKIGLDVLENQYGGDWSKAIGNDDPTIKNMFAIYGDEGLAMFDELRNSGSMGQSAQQMTTQGMEYRLQNPDMFQNQPQGQPSQQQGQGSNVPPGDAKAQFASYLQSLSEASGINPPSGAESSSQSQESTPQETFNIDQIPNNLLKPMAKNPPTAPNTLGQNIMGGSSYTRPSQNMRTTEYTEKAVGESVDETGKNDIRRKQVPRDPSIEGGRYAGTQYGQSLDREEMLRRDAQKESQFFPGYNTLSNDERELVAQTFEKTGKIPKSIEAVKEIMALQEEQAGMQVVKTVAENPASTPEEVAKVADAVGETEESFVKAALLDPASVKTIVAKYNSLNPPQFNEFIKNTNLPEGTQTVILKAAAESYKALNSREKVVYDKAVKAAEKNVVSASRPGKAGNPALAKALKGSQKVYANIALEFGKEVKDMDSAVIASTTPDQRSGLQLKEAAGQFDKQFQLQKEAQAAGVAMDWLKYNAAKDAMEGGGEGQVLTKETIDLMTVLQKEIENEMAPLLEKYGDDPEALAKAKNQKKLSDKQFAARLEAYATMQAQVLGVPLAKVKDTVENGWWFLKSETKLEYSVPSSGLIPTVVSGNTNTQNPGAVTDLSDEYSR